MRAAIFNPYLDTLGGGERYSMAVATVLAELGFKVDVQWKSDSIKKKLEDRFGIDLSPVNIIHDINRGDGYDVCFWVSDGSIPALKARKNFLHFQIPFNDINGGTLLNRMKLIRINKVICNSNFTKRFIDKEYKVNSIVIYPPVAVDEIKPKRKENIILFVGRFSELKQAKRQDILIEAFKKFYSAGYSDWKLVLVGGVEVGAQEYIAKLEKMIREYPITILKSPSFRELKLLYGTAKIFWSAAGYGVNEEKEPDKVEHFGITVVEAMSAGVVPIIFNAGGHKEILKQKESGFLWSTVGELVKFTKQLINTKGLMVNFSRVVKEESKKYSYDVFEKNLIKLL